ncbi:bifunctional phosphoribosylaminoimidazole carboxylase/phosphoribosylaminoimidazole succinocarboxamide synthetase [Octopus bimaculoides]|uniref:PurE domain-containing protein n=1 Tax=Octopus bimaculoides TaxID=37653 RepID=A0A0L8FR85_OCTBM|nr:bifunctional phosphoribosylaminoimidazole carboxylase/phosphoribosylaminoimidazole succinocarboxamide synthetase [Octopus bimaculoides]|eukprot:XP_014787618.1 PREDICTED: multifunctional protein ADE2-like [Octopus bimaculoides]
MACQLVHDLYNADGSPKAGKDVTLGDVLIEGKTKIVYDLPSYKGCVAIKSKDRITCGDGARAHDMEGKAVISNSTNSSLMKILNDAGIPTHFLGKWSDNVFHAHRCYMVPIEWVTRRVATGSFLKRNPGVTEGHRFSPVKLETFYKDDANHDPQWSREQIISAKIQCGDKVIGADDVDIMEKMTVLIFEILEKAWTGANCALIDMKIEFGVSAGTGDIVLADIIDSDSWRLWPSGDKRLMVDKQVYRDMAEVTKDGMETVKRNFQWVAEKVKEIMPKKVSQVVVFMGSASDMAFCQKIQTYLEKLHLPCSMRVTSAHKCTESTLKLLAEYEGEGIPTVIIAVAGRSNGLGPVLAGNTNLPVINCPPLSSNWEQEDLWSSLRLPSGLGCATVIFPEAAAIHAAQILALSNERLWAKMRVLTFKNWLGVKKSDISSRIC